MRSTCRITPGSSTASLPPTTVRSYVQYVGGSPLQYSYLGPVIVAQRDRPVRILFVNDLPNNSGGDLFIPVDPTVMGAGMGPTGAMYTSNRAELHLHGGATPWISDGTPHQWTTPVLKPGETAPAYPTGVSVYNVPDMGTQPIGQLTYYYTNQQSARLMFYHDHSYGITRLNVYAGEAAGYLVTDPIEQAMIAGRFHHQHRPDRNGGCHAVEQSLRSISIKILLPAICSVALTIPLSQPLPLVASPLGGACNATATASYICWYGNHHCDHQSRLWVCYGSKRVFQHDNLYTCS